MRIAHFIQRYPPALGGSEAYFARLGRFLAAAADEVSVFTSTALDLEAFWSRRGRCLEEAARQEEGVRVRRYGLWRFPGRRYLLKALSFFPQRRWQCMTMTCNPICWGMWRACRKEAFAFDVVHGTAFPYAWPIVCGQVLARRLGVPFVLTPFLHTGDPDDPRDRTRRSYTRPALMSLARDADRIFAQTEGERAELARHGVRPERIVLQGLGVAAEECTGGDRQGARRAWGVGPNEVVIGHLANNSREKGSVDLLLAARQLWQQSVPAQGIRVVLAGPEMPNFRAFWPTFAPGLPSPAAVLRLGVLDDQHKRDFFAGLDILALPSRSDSFGLVLLEAWANDVPSVVYRAGGLPYVVRHEQDGLVTRCGDIDALADALARLVQDEALRRRLATRGRQRLERDFRWQDKLSLVRDVYQTLARQPHVRH